MSTQPRLHLFKSKIHRATVTHADLDYEGSITVSEELLEASGIHEYEQVHVWNVTRGTRLVTYALKGNRDSGIVCINGAAAHLAKPGDLVIIATFAEVDASEARDWKPTVVLVDRENKVVDAKYAELAGPARRVDASA